MIVRMDAGFPEPGLLEGLESRSVPYIARIRKNEVLNRMAKPYLTQPAGRSPDAPPRLWFHELTYQAESWDRARRVVLVVRERPGELYPDHFWLLTSLSRKRYEAEALLAKIVLRPHVVTGQFPISILLHKHSILYNPQKEGAETKPKTTWLNSKPTGLCQTLGCGHGRRRRRTGGLFRGNEGKCTANSFHL